MKNTYKYVSLFFILSMILASGCAKKNNDPQPEPTEPFKSKLAERKEVIQIPAAFANNNSNKFALETRRYITTANATFGLYRNFLIIPGNTTQTSNGNWTWSDLQGNEIRYTSTLSGNEYKVTMEVSLADGTKYKLFEATENKDGTSGKVSWFDKTGKIVAVIDWKYENGVFISTLVSDELRIVSESSDDLSGTIKVYENGVLVFTGQWQSNGSGDCTSYNSDGTQNETGTW